MREKLVLLKTWNLEPGTWNIFLIWNLVLGTWNFVPPWNLEPGTWNTFGTWKVELGTSLIPTSASTGGWLDGTHVAELLLIHSHPQRIEVQ